MREIKPGSWEMRRTLAGECGPVPTEKGYEAVEAHTPFSLVPMAGLEPQFARMDRNRSVVGAN